MALGLISVFLSLKRCDKYLFLIGGLATLIYPIYGIAFASVNVVIFVMRKEIIPVIKMTITNVIFLIPWAYAYLSDSFSYREFSSFVGGGGGVVFPTFALSFAVLGIPVCIRLYKKHHFRKISTRKILTIGVALMVLVLLYSVSSVVQSGWYNGSGLGLGNTILFFMKIPLFLVAAAGFVVYASKSNDEFGEKFTMTWLLMFLSVILIPSELFPFSVRFQAFLWVPFSMMAGISIGYMKKPAVMLIVIITWKII